jgi:hypothetical protein
MSLQQLTTGFGRAVDETLQAGLFRQIRSASVVNRMRCDNADDLLAVSTGLRASDDRARASPAHR